jgi:hypothetical protein
MMVAEKRFVVDNALAFEQLRNLIVFTAKNYLAVALERLLVQGEIPNARSTERL